MAFCTKCGKQLDEDVKFCTSCGASIDQRDPNLDSLREKPVVDPHHKSSPSAGGNANDACSNKKRSRIIIGTIVAVIVILAAIVVAVMALSPKSQSGEVVDNVGHAVPADAYDIAGLVGMDPADIKSWLNSHSFTTYDQGGNSFARVVIDGTKEVPASDNPSKHTGWNTLSVQMYTLYSSVPEDKDIKSIFDDDASSQITPSSLASSNPRAATFVSTERAKDSSSFLKNTQDYMDRLIEQAGLDANGTVENKGDVYAIGSCTINGEDGMWLGVSEKVDDSYTGYVLCGYSSDMKQSLGISDSDAESLEKLVGVETSLNKATSSSNASESNASSEAQFAGITSATASSELPIDDLNPYGYDAMNLIDGDLQHAWVEGAPGTGSGEWIALKGDSAQGFSGFDIWSGYQKSEDLYQKNARPSHISVYVDGDLIGGYALSDSGLTSQRIDFGKTIKGKELKIVIEDVYPGSRDEDCAISEIKVF